LIPDEGNLNDRCLRAGGRGGEGHRTRQPPGSGTIDLGRFCFHPYVFIFCLFSVFSSIFSQQIS
jgi:hypothetical protein